MESGSRPAGRRGLFRKATPHRPGGASLGLVILGLGLVLLGVRGTLGYGPARGEPGDPGRGVTPTLTGQPTPTRTPFQPVVSNPTAAAPSLPHTTPSPIPSPTPAVRPPERIVIPSIELDAPIALSKERRVTLQNRQFLEWDPPDQFAAGWQEGSAPLGAVGNTVLNGHNNENGDVFLNLDKLRAGDTILIYSGGVTYTYRVSNRMILRELGLGLKARAANAVWIGPSKDERLTLVTCWPWTGNTHRLIIVARRVN